MPFGVLAFGRTNGGDRLPKSINTFSVHEGDSLVQLRGPSGIGVGFSQPKIKRNLKS